MQAVEQPPAPPSGPSGNVVPKAEDDLRLLLDWSFDKDERDRFRTATIGTAAVHLLLITALAIMPRQTPVRREFPDRERQLTHLIDPPTELTQKAPNKGKISKE